MIFDIRTIPPGHSILSQTTGLDAHEEDLPVFIEKISCDAEIDRKGPDLYVHLRFRGKFELACSRCLSPFSYPISGDLRLVIKEQPGRYGPAADDESADYYYDSRHQEIDVSFAIFEEIMTALPLKPLCREQCAGITVAESRPGPDEIDPRWEALKKIKSQF